MELLHRREFVQRTALLAGAAAVLRDVPASFAAVRAESRAVARADKLRVAVVGVRSRGMSHVQGFLKNPETEVTVICDCDEGVIASAMRTVEKAQGKPPRFEKDIRRVVADKEVDIVAIATPNHWHALMAVWAMEHGKDVYVEKPASHNVREGAIMTAVARRTGRICQVGTQSRSNPGMRQAIEYIHSGKIGKVELAIGLCYKLRPSIGDVGRREGEQKPPATMDYDLWCGPAPYKLPRRRTKNGTVHYDWHWIWDYGNGDLGNQGVHEMDKARWGLNNNTLPRSVFSIGGRFGYIDDGETANTQLCVFDYDPQLLVFEVRGLPTKDYKGAKVGNIWVGTEGYVVCPNYSGGVAYDPKGREVAKFSSGSDQYHFDNFVQAVRTRKYQTLHADIADGHLSAALCHLANISYRLGVEAPIGSPRSVSDQKVVQEFTAAMLEHLRENKVDVEKTIGRFGPLLTIDPKTERIVGNEAANALLFREYRKGFELKDIG